MENELPLETPELRDNPFSRTAGAIHPYLSSSFRDALAALYYALEFGSRILMLSADRGLGKTTLLRHFERRIRERGRTLFLSPNHDDGPEALRKLVDEIGGGTAASDDLLAMRMRTDQILPGVAQAENPFILLLDYDRDAEHSALETLRCLTSLKSFEQGLLRVVIASSPHVGEELRASEFADEIRGVSLGPLAAAEVEGYINHRLRLVGWRADRLFTAKACALIAERSAANPLTINAICFNLLQGLVEPESAGFGGTTRNKDQTLDEEDVASLLAEREPAGSGPTERESIVRTSAHSANRRTAALGGVILMLVLAVVGLWYRSTIMRIARPITGEITEPLAQPVYTAVTTTGAIDKIVATDASNKAASPGPDGTKTRPLHAASPEASTLLSPTPENIGASHRAGSGMPPVQPSLSARAGLNNVGDRRAEAAAATNHDVERATLSPLVGPRETPTLSAVPPQATVTDTGAASRTTVAARTVSSPARSAEEMAADEIKLGDAYMKIGDYDNALDSFSRAIGFAPDNKEAEEKVKRARRAKTAEEDILQ